MKKVILLFQTLMIQIFSRTLIALKKPQRKVIFKIIYHKPEGNSPSNANKSPKLLKSLVIPK